MNYWIKCILYIKRWFNINLYQFSIPYPLCIIHKSVATMKSIHPNPTTRLVIQIECSPLYIAVWNSFQIASNQNFCHQDTQLHTLVNCRMNCTKLIGGEGNVTIPVKESQQRDDYKEMQWILTKSRKNSQIQSYYSKINWIGNLLQSFCCSAVGTRRQRILCLMLWRVAVLVVLHVPHTVSSCSLACECLACFDQIRWRKINKMAKARQRELVVSQSLDECLALWDEETKWPMDKAARTGG